MIVAKRQQPLLSAKVVFAGGSGKTSHALSIGSDRSQIIADWLDQVTTEGNIYFFQLKRIVISFFLKKKN